MTATLSVTYSSFLTTFQPRQEHLWFGCFTNDILMVVKGVSPNGRVSYFQVLDNNRLQSYTFDCSYLQDLRSAPVRVVAKTGKKWILDPYPSIAHMCGQWYHVVIRKRSCYKIKMGSGGLALVTLLGGKDRKGPLFSVLSKTWKIITAFSECKDTSSSETLDQLGCFHFAFENLLEMDMVIQGAN